MSNQYDKKSHEPQHLLSKLHQLTLRTKLTLERDKTNTLCNSMMIYSKAILFFVASTRSIMPDVKASFVSHEQSRRRDQSNCHSLTNKKKCRRGSGCVWDRSLEVCAYVTDPPTSKPTEQPTSQPTGQPTFQPTVEPTFTPTSQPTGQPTFQPTVAPTFTPTNQPTLQPSESHRPSASPTDPSCELLAVRPCVRDPTCTWIDSSKSCITISEQPSSQPSISPTNPCKSMNQRKCLRDSTCEWNDSSKVCFPVSEQPSFQPSRDSNYCQSFNKRTCKKDSMCKWNDTFQECIRVLDLPTL